MTDLPEVDGLLDALAGRLNAELARRGITDPLLVGVHSGGVWVAEALRTRLGIAAAVGTLNISFHRDDFGRAGLSPSVHPSALPWDVGDRHIVLVDDVLWTGRTVRAAINEIFDWGRPAAVLLAVLVERNGRELPVAADAVGAHVDLAPGEHVKLRGPAPLRLERIARQQP
jgi:pyrimidine operon attenuation protein/uracil phosphoribosyltransferase